jgi:hypothetical protein
VRHREAHLPTEPYEHFLRNLRTIRSFRQKEFDYLSKPAIDYRCYLMIGQSIRGVEVVHCRQDADAILEAAKLLDSKSEFDLVEIWAGARIVGRFPRRPKKPG